MTKRRAAVIVSVLALAMTAIVPAASAQDGSVPAVVRDGNQWLLRDSLSGGTATTQFHYGRADDGQQMMCDWNGDGEKTPGVIRDDDGRPRWLLRDANSGGSADHSFVYGRETDWAVCGDWNGDGTQTPGIVREDSQGRFVWHLRNSLSGGPADATFFYGRDLTPGDLPPTWPVVGDWNGDGTDTVGIVRGHDAGQFQWLLRDSNTGGTADHDFYYYSGAVWGDHLEVHTPVVGDWNGDGADGPGAIRSSGATNYRWLLRDSLSGGFADHVSYYGRFLDIPLEWE